MQCQRPRLVPPHKGFHEQHPSLLAVLDHVGGLSRIECQRLFAKHVLAGVSRCQYPRLMQLVGERYIDRLDRRVTEQILIRSVGRWDIKFLGPRAGSGKVAARQGGEFSRCRFLDPRDQAAARDPGTAQNSPRERRCRHHCCSRSDFLAFSTF